MDRCRNCGEKEASHQESMGNQPPELLLATKVAPTVNKLPVRATSAYDAGEAVAIKVVRPKPAQLGVVDRAPVLSDAGSPPLRSRATPPTSQPTTPRASGTMTIKSQLQLEDQNASKCRNAAVVAELTAIESLALVRNIMAIWGKKANEAGISADVAAEVSKRMSSAEDGAEQIRRQAFVAIEAAQNSNAPQATKAAEQALELLGDVRKDALRVLTVALGDSKNAASLAGCQMAEIQAETMALVASESSKHSNTQTALQAAKKWSALTAVECDKVLAAVQGMNQEEAIIHRDAAWRAALRTRACVEIVSSVTLDQHEGLVQDDSARAQAAVLAAENAALRCSSLQRGVEAALAGKPPPQAAQAWTRLVQAVSQAEQLAPTARACLGTDHQVAKACSIRDQVEALLNTVEQESESLLLASQAHVDQQVRPISGSGKMAALAAQADVEIADVHSAKSQRSIIEAAKDAAHSSAQTVNAAREECEAETDAERAREQLLKADRASEATSQAAALLYSILVNLEQAKMGFLLQMEPPRLSEGERKSESAESPPKEGMGDDWEEERVALRTLVARRIAAEDAQEGIVRHSGLEAKTPLFEAHSAAAIRAAHVVKRAVANNEVAEAKRATELMRKESELARNEVVETVQADLEPSVWLERVMTAARATEELNACIMNADPTWSFTLQDLSQRATQITQHLKDLAANQPGLEIQEVVDKCNKLVGQCSEKSAQNELGSGEAGDIAGLARDIAKQTLTTTTQVSSNEGAMAVEGANQAANEMLQIANRLEPSNSGDTAQMVEWADATIQCVITQQQRAMEAYTMGRLQNLRVQSLEPRLYPDHQAIVQATYRIINSPQTIDRDMEFKQLQQQADAEVTDLQSSARFKIQTVIAVYYPPTFSLTKRIYSPSVSKLVIVDHPVPEPSFSLEVNPDLNPDLGGISPADKQEVVQTKERELQAQTPTTELGAFGQSPTTSLLEEPSREFADHDKFGSPPQGQPRLKLRIKAKNLLQLDWTSTLDPLVALYQLDDDLGTYHLVQQTEVLQDSLDPEFSTTFTMRYKPDINQQFLLRAYAVSGARLGEDAVLGSAMFSLDQVMKEQALVDVRLPISNVAEVLLNEQLKKANSCFLISYEYDYGKHEPIAEIELSVACQHLPVHLEPFQRCVPLVSLFREDKHGMFAVVDQTEKSRTEGANPKFRKRFKLSHNPAQPQWYKVSVFNLIKENSAIKIGSARVDMVDLAAYGNKKTYVLTNPSLDLGGASVVFQCVKRVEHGSKLGQQIVTEFGVPELDPVVDEAKARRQVTESVAELSHMMSMGRAFRRLWTKDTPTRVSLFYNPNDHKLFWCPETWDNHGTKQINILEKRSLKLVDISHIILGKQTPAFHTGYAARMGLSAGCCFSLLSQGAEANLLNLAASTELQRDAWVCGLRMVAAELKHDIQIVEYGDWKGSPIEERGEDPEPTGLTTVWAKLNSERARKREAADRNRERLDQINNTGQLFNMGLKGNNPQNTPLYDPDSELGTKMVRFADMTFSCVNLPPSSSPYTICVWQRDADAKDWMYVSKTDNIRGQSPVFKKKVKLRYWGMNQVVKFVVCMVQGHKLTDSDCVAMYKTSLSAIMSGKRGVGYDGQPANKDTPGPLRFSFPLSHPDEAGQQVLSLSGAALNVSCERMLELQNKQPPILASTNKAPIRAMIRGTQFWVFSPTGPPQEGTIFFRKDELKELQTPIRKKKDSLPSERPMRPSLLERENLGQLFHCDVGQTVELPGCSFDVSGITDVYLGTTGPAFQNPLSMAQQPDPSRCMSLVCGSVGNGPRLDLMAPSTFLRDSWVGGIQTLLKNKVVIHPAASRRLSEPRGSNFLIS